MKTQLSINRLSVLILLSFFGIVQKGYSQNTYATATNLGTLTCIGSPYNSLATGTTVGAGNECGNASTDRWCQFTITAALDVTVSLCNSSYDTYLKLYDSGASNKN